MKYVVNVSGGLTSFEAWRRTINTHGKENTVAVFADTLIEDEDLYRFLNDTQTYLDAELVVLRDGRTPFQAMHDARCFTIKSTAPCSKQLKTVLINKWIEENYPGAVRVFGMDWTEINRMERLAKRYDPDPVWFPLNEAPYVAKEDIIAFLESVHIDPPRLYAMGFAHNNCGGGCVKAGQAHWAHLLKTMPERYAMWEKEEEDLRAYLNKDVAILKDRRGGTSKPLTLRVFRERIAAGETRFDPADWGGCGCFLAGVE